MSAAICGYAVTSPAYVVGHYLTPHIVLLMWATVLPMELIRS
jgi:hypothetical protein